MCILHRALGRCTVSCQMDNTLPSHEPHCTAVYTFTVQCRWYSATFFLNCNLHRSDVNVILSDLVIFPSRLRRDIFFTSNKSAFSSCPNLFSPCNYSTAPTVDHLRARDPKMLCLVLCTKLFNTPREHQHAVHQPKASVTHVILGPAQFSAEDTEKIVLTVLMISETDTVTMCKVTGKTTGPRPAIDRGRGKARSVPIHTLCSAYVIRRSKYLYRHAHHREKPLRCSCHRISRSGA